MNKNTVSQLLKKYAEGNCNPEEQALVDRWYLSEAAKRSPVDPKNPIAEHDLIWKGLQVQLSLNEFSAEATETVPSENPGRILRMTPLKWLVAASLLLVASFAFYRLATSDNHEKLMAEIRKNDIAPGKNTATLTLADGKTINLSDAKTGVVIDARGLAYSDGTAITSSLSDSLSSRADAKDLDPPKFGMTTSVPEVAIESWKAFSRKMMNVRTPRGGTYQVLLPDGSKVWLNAASSLSFPEQFDKQVRVVMLIGEAYFEIAKNPEQPFRVLTIGQHINVLGTHFNVQAYRHEPGPLTTLVEGSVNVSWNNQTALLKPGEQAFTANKTIKISKGNIEEALAWKNGKFKFSNESIESLMKKISRWYDVDIEYRGEITKERFGGQVSKFAKVSDILEVLQLTGFVHFKIEGPDQKGSERRIIVLP